LTVKCPKCNAENPDTQKICGECGAYLGPAKDISAELGNRKTKNK